MFIVPGVRLSQPVLRGTALPEAIVTCQDAAAGSRHCWRDAPLDGFLEFLVLHSRHFKMRIPARVRGLIILLRERLFKRAGIAILFLVALLVFGASEPAITHLQHISHPDKLAGLPSVFLWAWERREDLTSIDPSKVGVAYLAETIYLSGNSIHARPRMQPLRVPPATAMIAVVRIESDPNHQPHLSADQRKELAQRIGAMAAKKEIRAIQIDYDARRSERSFYRELISDVRQSLPANVPLSMTALASWCLEDNWIADLPVDEAVPMVFQMGRDSVYVNEHFRSGEASRVEYAGTALELPHMKQYRRRLKGSVFTSSAIKPGTNRM
jgi:hypothetical protein